MRWIVAFVNPDYASTEHMKIGSQWYGLEIPPEFGKPTKSRKGLYKCLLNPKSWTMIRKVEF